MRRRALALLVAGLGGLVACQKGDPPELPGILLITLDTTRADHVGAYGYERDTTPHLDALAQDAELYEQASSTSSWTLPAHASLFTGKMPSAHGARYDPQGPLILSNALDGESFSQYRARGLSPAETPLASQLSERGYRTAAVVGGPWMKRVFGLDAGFDLYDDEDITSVNGRSAQQITDRAIAWLEDHQEDPFFLFLNYYDPHAPYSPPREAARRFVGNLSPAEQADPMAMTRALYDAELWFTDQHVGRLLEHLRQQGLLDDMLVVVTADHGDLLGDQGMVGHGRTLTEAEIHIPLIVKYPAADGRRGRRTERVQLTDVYATILEEAGLAVPLDSQGSSLPGGDHPIVAEVSPLAVMSPMGDWRVLIQEDYKYHWNSLGNSMLFDLSQDPYERNSLSGKEADRARFMDRRLTEYIEALKVTFQDGPTQVVDPDVLESLKEFGYLGDDENGGDENGGDENGGDKRPPEDG